MQQLRVEADTPLQGRWRRCQCNNNRCQCRYRFSCCGGGVAGFFASQACLERGLGPVCFESSDGCGGLWRGRGEYDTAAYDSLHIRTDVNHGSFMGLALPSELRSKWFCQWINGGAHIDVVAKYIEAFVAKFGLDKYVRFNTTVVKVEKRGDGWRVLDLRCCRGAA